MTFNRSNYLPFVLLSLFLMFSCVENEKKTEDKKEEQKESSEKQDSLFTQAVDEFADIKIIRYDVPGWDELSAKQKELVYYLGEAGLEGRDILWDQNYKHNLTIRKALESIYKNYDGDKDSDDWKNFETYLKQIWFANGIHHHYSNNKFKPKFDKDYLNALLEETDTELSGEAFEVIFNDKDAKKVNLDEAKGLIEGSAVNFYGSDITADEVDEHYEAMESPDPDKPLSFGLNSKLVKEDGELKDLVWKSGGMYGDAIDKIIYWLEKAADVAENEQQEKAIRLLIEYYETGDLEKWDEHSVAWVKATEGDIDYINGFIEVYEDPKGYKATFESVVQITDFDMSEKMKIIGDNAQWFEDNSPIMNKHKKEEVVGISYKTVNVAAEAGDNSPATPIGINLPNANWIREQEGSKSVSLHNIIDAYSKAGDKEQLEEFAYDDDETELSKEYGEIADNLHTALHEVVGHASGRINKGVGETKKTLKSYASTIEEGRADLVGLYYLFDPKMEELEMTDDYEKLGKAAYNDYIRNGLMTQLIRIEEGDDIEESHMRNRHWISQWVYEKGKDNNVIEKKVEDDKTYYVVQDYEQLRALFGELLREVQRIKSEGDYDAAKHLVEDYGVKIDQDLHQEILKRNEAIAARPYSGFVNPVIEIEEDNDGAIKDIRLTQPESFEEQMLNYSEQYGNLE